mgnify:CR=1 FL=1
MRFAIDKKINPKPLNYPYEDGNFDIYKRSGEINYATTINVLLNFDLVRTPPINGYKLIFDYIHLLEQEQFDEK